MVTCINTYLVVSICCGMSPVLAAREQALFSGQRCSLQEVRVGCRRRPFAKSSWHTHMLLCKAWGSPSLCGSARCGAGLERQKFPMGERAVDAGEGTNPAS